jgi:hypothetical protein
LKKPFVNRGRIYFPSKITSRLKQTAGGASLNQNIQRVCDKNVGILFFRYVLYSLHPIPLLPSPLKGEKPYAFALFGTKTLPVFPPLQGWS